MIPDEGQTSVSTSEPTTPPPLVPPAPRGDSSPAADTAAEARQSAGHAVVVRDLNAYYGDRHTIKGMNIRFAPNEITALIGPSGSGKSTVVRCINRMHEEIPGARVEGSVLLDDEDVYGPKVDVTAVRRVIGMVFQRPNPFPTMSIFDNVAAGLRLAGVRKGVEERVHEAIRSVGLWDEVKDRLKAAGVSLSGGQQQRLCIARTVAVQPDVVLMDEPCSALDPVATLKIEELISQLKSRYTIAIVTHNMQQAARVADTTAFMLDGELIEHGPTAKMFTNPDDERTEQYVTGKFG